MKDYFVDLLRLLSQLCSCVSKNVTRETENILFYCGSSNSNHATNSNCGYIILFSDDITQKSWVRDGAVITISVNGSYGYQ